MIRIAVYDQDILRLKRLMEAFDYYNFNRNAACEVVVFHGQKGLDGLKGFPLSLHVALTSVDAEGSVCYCDQILEKYPDCRICYYKTLPGLETNISNPLFFMDKGNEATEKNERFAREIDHFLEDFSMCGKILIFDTRQLLHLVPTEEVLYLQSDLKYINIVCREDSISVYKKLDAVEGLLPPGFLRIHKSYIVNRAYIRQLNKPERTILLKNGEELPISQSQYASVLRKIGDKA